MVELNFKDGILIGEISLNLKIKITLSACNYEYDRTLKQIIE